MKDFLKSNLWIYSAIIYPLSWVTYSGPNLSFLAWIALVPLFVFLSQNTNNFKKFYGASFAVTLCWTMTTSGWLLNFPVAKWQVVAAILTGTIEISSPFLALYFILKKIEFKKAILLLPFIWVAWEWLYLPMPHTMGTHLLAYGQGNNIWLIQMADLGGMWLISFWVMSFNVLMYSVLSNGNWKWNSKQFAIKAVKLSAALILPVLLYGFYSIQKFDRTTGKSLQISIVPTQFDSDYLVKEENQKAIIETTLHRTDSLAYDLNNARLGSDLYVWPETGTTYWQAFSNLTSLLHQATTDWQGSLFTGCKGIPIEGDTLNAYVSGVMVTPGFEGKETSVQYHHKTELVPGSETIPYKNVINFFKSKSETKIKTFVKGSSFEPLRLTTKDGVTYSVGASLCYEQWFPSAWTKQVRKGAEFFVHIAAEGWYGNTGFAQFMANVSRIRAVETRRSVVRSSNIGLSMFINPVGKTYDGISYGSLDMATAKVYTSSEMTLFSQFPNAFPMLCLLLSVSGFLSSLLGGSLCFNFLR